MTNLNTKPLGGNLARRDTPRRVPVVLTPPKSARPMPAASLRVPVTRANQAYLRALRQAEMVAWKKAGNGNSNPARRGEHSPAALQERRDLRLFALLVALSAATAAVVLSKSFPAAAQWTDFLGVVRQLLG